MGFTIKQFSSQEIAIALQKARNGEELTDREIAALNWEVEI